MNKLNDELDKKLKDIYLKFKNINSNEFKKKLILYDNINNYINNIENTLDDYEINNMSDLELDDEINERISNKKKVNKLIKDLGPLIIYYQLNNI